jgi:hypothetical protein
MHGGQKHPTQMDARIKALDDQDQEEAPAARLSALTAELASQEAAEAALAAALAAARDRNARLAAEAREADAAAAREAGAAVAARDERRQQVFVAARQHRANETRWVRRSCERGGGVRGQCLALQYCR